MLSISALLSTAGFVPSNDKVYVAPATRLNPALCCLWKAVVEGWYEPICTPLSFTIYVCPPQGSVDQHRTKQSGMRLIVRREGFA